jgi:ABC-type Fe3+-siderophore transport system permease subunit
MPNVIAAGLAVFTVVSIATRVADFPSEGWLRIVTAVLVGALFAYVVAYRRKGHT